MVGDTEINEKEPILSLIECATNGGYRVETRVPESMNLSPHPQAGIAATTGTGETAENIYTGPCLLSPFDTEAISQGYNPLTYDMDSETGDALESYDEFASEVLRGGGIPRVSQIVDHWGITGKQTGTVVVVLEDDEWPYKVCNALEQGGIDFDTEQVYEDVHNAYENIVFETFTTYVTEVLNNDVDVVPLFTSDHSENIDSILDEATNRHNVKSSFDEENRNKQRINMYTTPIWLDYIETELGLESGSIDISDPIRYYDELYNYDGEEDNIFRDYMVDYFSQDTENRQYEFHIIPPLLAPFRKGYEFSRDRISHSDSIIPRKLESVLERLDPQNSTDIPDLIHLPIARSLSGFPNRADLALEVLNMWESELDKQSEWKHEAKLSVVGYDISDDEVQREPGIKISEEVKERRQQFRASSTGDSDKPILERAHEAIEDDLSTLLTPVQAQT